ncbi:MAG: hypothetical protein QS748_09475 [Candidatus Endonucleobacter bathymodioli]|uniref:Uncharacterized protein n=1 Tax=Candidatus Endonucleibacter bathymodioli TaxID=539814 RepID=A0AA90SY88_9GAMM|nr:hypothetical protein [Candidatus Endonucleobacter bathymodioli]
MSYCHEALQSGGMVRGFRYQSAAAMEYWFTEMPVETAMRGDNSVGTGG